MGNLGALNDEVKPVEERTEVELEYKVQEEAWVSEWQGSNGGRHPQNGP